MVLLFYYDLIFAGNALANEVSYSYNRIFFTIDDSYIFLYNCCKMGREFFVSSCARTSRASLAKVSSEGVGMKQPPTAGIVAGIALAQA